MKKHSSARARAALLASRLAVFVIVCGVGVLWPAETNMLCAQESSDGPRGLPSAVMQVQQPDLARTAESLRGAKIHRTLGLAWNRRGDAERIKAWVLFSDKGLADRTNQQRAIAEVASKYNARAIRRRRLRRVLPDLFDAHDLPVSRTYVDAVRAAGAKVHVVSKWVNGVSVWANKTQLERIDTLPFVRQLQPVLRFTRVAPKDANGEIIEARVDGGTSGARGGSPYGESEEQLTQINLIALHEAGFTGESVVVGILDTGFVHTHAAFNEPGHTLNIVAERDFVKDDPITSDEANDVPGQHNHGTWVLSTMAAYRPGEMLGGAFDASFILCKTEDLASEGLVEEDNFVAALEFVEANGGDMFTSSLGYLGFDNPADSYTQADLDGLTAISTLGVNIASANGLHGCKSAGNRGHDSNPNTSRLGSPGDAFFVISVGATNNTGAIAGFSSDGPTADGRVKPEVLARGVNTRVVSHLDNSSYVGLGGTSFSAPLVAGAVACLTQAHPEWTVAQMRNYLFRTADYFVANGTFEPTYVRGYGIINAFAASAGDCNGNGIDDADDIAGGMFPDCDGNGLPDECDLVPPGDGRDCNNNGSIDACDVADQVSPDCNANNIPDECDADCNNDGTPSDCETETALQDCDKDGVCNILEIATCPSNQPSCADCNGNDRPDGCDLALGLSPDIDGNGIPDECIQAPRVADAPHDGRKNRYLSFTPNNATSIFAIRVELTDRACSVTGDRCAVDADCAVCVGGESAGSGCQINGDCAAGTCEISGEACEERGAPAMLGWIGEPRDPSCQILDTGEPLAGNPNCLGVDFVSRVAASPVFREWPEPVVHVGDCEIAPVQSYSLMTTIDGITFSPPYHAGTIARPGTRFWGDVVGEFAETGWTQPNLLVNVNDVLAWIKFITLPAGDPGRPHTTWVDLDGESPNWVVNATDVQLILQGFQSKTYPPVSFPNSQGPADCP